MKNNSDNVAVSIIIPIYNEGKTIERCINSILAQSLKDVEILCCDDGSTDDTLEKLKVLQKENDNIVILCQQNLGAGPARNKCLNVARGEYICFMDADDYYLDENALKTLYTEIKKNNHKVGCGLMQENDANGKAILFPLFRDIVCDSSRVVHFRDYQNDTFFQCYMISRELIIDNHIKFPPFRRFQDPPFLVQCLHAAEEFIVIPVEFYYHHHDDNKVLFEKTKTNHMVQGMKWQIEFAIKHDYQDLISKMLMRLNGEFYGSIILRNLENNYELLKLLIDINDLFSCDEYVLNILKCITSNVEKKDFLKDELLNRLQLTGKILVYGAGNIGKKCVVAMQEINQIEIVGWVDKYLNGIQINDIYIEPIDSIAQKEYEKILIAIQKKEVIDEVRVELIGLGVNEDKIVSW